MWHNLIKIWESIIYSKWHYSLYVAEGVLWICSSSHSPLLLDHRNASPPTWSLRASVTVAAVSPLRTPNSVRARVTTIPPGSCSSRVMMSSKKYAFSLPLPLPRTGTGNTHRGHRTQRMSDLNCPKSKPRPFLSMSLFFLSIQPF